MSPTEYLPFVDSLKDRVTLMKHVKSLFQDVAQRGQVIRPLLPSELETLVSCKNKCKDWSKIRLWLDDGETNKDWSGWLEHNVTFNIFDGLVAIRVVPLDKTSPSSPATISPGIHFNVMISNCVLGSRCRVYRNVLLQDTYIGDNSTVVSNGQMTCEGETTYGSLSITVGAEIGGGRKLSLQAESSMLDVCRMLGMNRSGSLSHPLTSSGNENCSFNVIGNDCVVRDTPTIQNIFMAPFSRIEAATLVQQATLLPAAMIGHSSTAKRVLLQWDSSITHQSHVSDTLLMEQAHAGPHSMVAETVLGPDAHLSAGEVHASVIGPNTNAHHQSLVIGVLWPLGRGNVGYGANVGSNHTGRLPDQETVAAEGTFWGLSTVIKFPVDLSLAPYSLVAAGTTMIPQRVSMPFSLLVDGDILPGWVLHNSPYTLSRSEQKFAKRRKAKRHDFYTGWKIVRPSTMNLCYTARQALTDVGTIKSEYRSEKEVQGIGKMVLSEKARNAGIIAYTAIIHRYALSGLLDYCQRQGMATLEQELASTSSAVKLDEMSIPIWPVLPWEEEDAWNHQMSILLNEFPRDNDVAFPSWIATLLQELVHLEKDYADRIASCKRRDDTRGSTTIPNYEDAHVAAADDEVVQESKQYADEVERAVQSILQSTTMTARSKL